MCMFREGSANYPLFSGLPCIFQVESAYRMLQAKYADDQKKEKSMDEQRVNPEAQEFDIQVNGATVIGDNCAKSQWFLTRNKNLI